MEPFIIMFDYNIIHTPEKHNEAFVQLPVSRCHKRHVDVSTTPVGRNAPRCGAAVSPTRVARTAVDFNVVGADTSHFRSHLHVDCLQEYATSGACRYGDP